MKLKFLIIDNRAFQIYFLALLVSFLLVPQVFAEDLSGLEDLREDRTINETVSESQEYSMPIAGVTKILADAASLQQDKIATIEYQKKYLVGNSDDTLYDTDENMILLNDTEVDDNEQYKIDEVNYVQYVNATALNIREEPSEDSEILGKLKVQDEVTVIGELEDDENWVQIQYNNDNSSAFISANYLVDTKDDITTHISIPSNWSGEKLNSENGRVYGPGGYETYYNLPMQGVIRIMKDAGYNYEYWIRDDGVKMYGNYIMVAANLSEHPRGSIVDTSLGKAIVCDTGSFAHNGSGTSYDIAVDW